MKAAFSRRFTQDQVLQELIRSKVELTIDIKFPKELIKNIEAIQKKRSSD